MRTRITTTLLAVGMTAALAACAAPAANDHNGTDIAFAAQMIPHHQGAIAMAEAVLDEDDLDPRVVDLAERIQAAQLPEIDQLQSWLTEWGEDPGAHDTGAHGTGDGGMMGEADMAALDAASGAEADRLFLEGMIVHHEGAVEMAELELAEGVHTGALAMAQQIVDGQSAEIDEMRALLSEG